MTKTNSFVKRFIAVILSALFALTSFTITGFVPTMEAQAAVSSLTVDNLDSNLYGRYLEDQTSVTNNSAPNTKGSYNMTMSRNVSWSPGTKTDYAAVNFTNNDLTGANASGIYSTYQSSNDSLLKKLKDISGVTDDYCNYPFTISFMAKPSSSSSMNMFGVISHNSVASNMLRGYTVDSLATNVNNNRYLNIDTTGRFRFAHQWEAFDAGATDSAPASPYNDGWDYWTLSFQPRSSNDNVTGHLRIYKNNTLIKDYNHKVIDLNLLLYNSTTGSNYHGFFLGNGPISNNGGFDGQMRDFRFYAGYISDLNVVKKITSQQNTDAENTKTGGSDLVEKLKDEMSKFESRFSNRYYANLTTDYIYYVKAQAALDANTYSNESDTDKENNLQTAYDRLKNANTNNSTQWVYPSFNQSSNFGPNVETTNPYTNALWVENNNDPYLRDKDVDSNYVMSNLFAHDAVYVYDGSTQIRIPILMKSVVTYWGATSPTRYIMGYYNNSSLSPYQTGLSLAGDWHVNNSSTRNFSLAWSGSARVANVYITNPSSRYVSGKNTTFWLANYINVDSPTVLGTSTYKQLSIPRVWTNHIGGSTSDNWQDTIDCTESRMPTIYLLNFKPTNDFVNNYSIINISDYKQGGFKSAVDKFQTYVSPVTLSGINASNVSATQAQVQQLTTSNTELAKSITITTDSSSQYPALRTAITNALAITDSSLYTKTSWANFQTALNNAQTAMKYRTISGDKDNTYNIDTAYPAGVSSYTTALNTARSNLKTTAAVGLYKGTTDPSTLLASKDFAVKTTIAKVVSDYKTEIGGRYIKPSTATAGTQHVDLDSYLVSDNKTVVDDDNINVIFALENCTYNTVRTKDPSCKEKGIDTHTCSKCGAQYTTEVDYSDHTLPAGNWTKVVGSVTPQHYKQCSVCDKYIYENCNYVTDPSTAKNPTCTEAGKEADKICDGCKDVQSGAVIEAAGHNYVVSDTNGIEITYTCTADDEHPYSGCGDSYKEYGEASVEYGYVYDSAYTKIGDIVVSEKYEDIDKLVNAIKGEITIIAVPGENGKHIITNKDYSYNASRNRLEFEAEACEFEQDHTDPPSCSEEGLDTYTCSCGNSYTKTVEKLPHTVVVDPAKEPTCTETGLTAGSHCSVCNEVLVAQEVVEAKGHNFTATALDTSTTDVYTWHTVCSRCSTQNPDEVVPLYQISVVDFNAAKAHAELSCGNEDYTLTSREELQNDYVTPASTAVSAIVSAFTDTVPTEEQVTLQAEIDAQASSIISADKLKSQDGVLEYVSYTVTFNYALDGVVNDNESLKKTYNPSKYDQVIMNIAEFNLGNVVATKWISSDVKGDIPVQTSSDQFTYVANASREFIVYLSTTDKAVSDTMVSASIGDKLNRLYDVVYIEKGEYTASKNGQDNLVLSSANKNYEITPLVFPFYNIQSFTINGVDISSPGKNVINVQAPIKIQPVYVAKQSGKSLYTCSDEVDQCHRGCTHDKITATSKELTYIYNQPNMLEMYSGAKWDTFVSFTTESKTVYDWYIYYLDTPILNASQKPSFSQMTKVSRGSSMSIRVTQDKYLYVDVKPVSGSDLAISSTNFLTYDGYRANTITSTSKYYVPAGAELLEAGVIYRTDKTGNASNAKKNLETVTVEYGKTGSGQFKASVFVKDSSQYTINYYASKHYDIFAVAAKSYIIYRQNGEVKYAYSDIVTFTK